MAAACAAPVEQLAPDLWSIPVPIPDSPLRYLSAYVFGAGDGVVLLDAARPPRR